MDPYLTPKEAAAILRLRTLTLYRPEWRKRLQAVRIGPRRLLIPKAAVLALLQAKES